MDQVKIRCEQCGQKVGVRNARRKKKSRCPTCGHVNRLRSEPSEPAQIRFECDHCGAAQAVPELLAEKQVRCDQCGGVNNVPVRSQGDTSFLHLINETPEPGGKEDSMAQPQRRKNPFVFKLNVWLPILVPVVVLVAGGAVLAVYAPKWWSASAAGETRPEEKAPEVASASADASGGGKTAATSNGTKSSSDGRGETRRPNSGDAQSDRTHQTDGSDAEPAADAAAAERETKPGPDSGAAERSAEPPPPPGGPAGPPGPGPQPTASPSGPGDAASGKKELYVRASGDDGNKGTSPAKALATVGAAIEACDGPGHTIYVGPGVYDVGSVSLTTAGTKEQPNRLVGDPTGEHTGGEAGEVVLEGSEEKKALLSLQGADHWTITDLTLRGFSTYGVYAYRCNGLRVADCTIVSSGGTAFYGVYGYQSTNLDVEHNRFRRTLEEKYAYPVYVYAYQVGKGTIRVRRNRMNLTGDDYLGSRFVPSQGGDPKKPSPKKQGAGGRKGSGEQNKSYHYGVFIYSYQSGEQRCVIQNNVITDAYVPAYVYASVTPVEATITSNTLVGASYPIYVSAYQAPKTRVTLANNIISRCYTLPVVTEKKVARVEVAGLLLSEIQKKKKIPSSWKSVAKTPPLFIKPQAGDFTPESGSKAVDGGASVAVPDGDIAGAPRPADGNGDGKAVADIGAVEVQPADDGAGKGSGASGG